MTVHPARAGQLDTAPRRVLVVSPTTDEVVVMGVENPLARQLWQCAGGFATFRDHFDTLHRTHSTRDHHASFCIKKGFVTVLFICKMNIYLYLLDIGCPTILAPLCFLLFCCLLLYQNIKAG